MHLAFFKKIIDALRMKRKRNPELYTPERYAWRSMHDRCRHHRRYFGRGIKVSEEWGCYDNFLADMGRRPSPGHSLDRIDNDGHYGPDNCRWATKSEQALNRGKKMPKKDMDLAKALKKTRESLAETQKQFAERIGVNQGTISRWEESGPTSWISRTVLRRALDDIEAARRVIPVRQ